jgi:hypothetical protein
MRLRDFFTQEGAERISEQFAEVLIKERLKAAEKFLEEVWRIVAERARGGIA